MKLPITQKLDDLIHHHAISLHVPGHKNMTIGYLDALSLKMDMTEITGLDDLHHPEDTILESMNGVNKHPNYDAYYLVNGTTAGILSVIQAFAHIKGRYLISRNVHKSVFNALDLTQQSADILPMYRSDKSYQYLAPLIDTKMLRHQKLAVVTYPNYYGECFDINQCVKQFHDYNIPVLIDEAHGAHFNLKHFPKSALESEADYVVQSYHKTLPTLTMGSILFIHKNAPLKDEVIKYLGIFQTSSPSYLVMSSIELAHQFYNFYDSSLFFEKRKQFIETLRQQHFEVIEVDDPLKLIVRANGHTGFEVQRYFEKNHIYIELADDYQTLIVLPLWHFNDRYPFETLLHRIKTIQLPKKAKEKLEPVLLPLEKSVYVSKYINHAYWININKAQDKVLAQHIVPYPPGIPVFWKGEKVAKNMIKLMQYYLSHSVRVEGIKNDKILVKDE
ncbi:lysine decarboxylase [Staphylococcus hominis]|uniref:Orn/Lys/Arg family decarboxylase n=1 Tax=Staphylococcus hominis TaxID=1290 RepID=UPI000E67B623|nr:aminotransferase class V-fold PLP-dependent enzyme [Staphylococcus hominis]RIO54939.1 lysine decarboxylase [Staphylococcus hominis]